ncbi:restriction endonuclease [Clostridium sp. DL1XJH146]
MGKIVKFQFEKLDYQKKAVSSIIKLFGDVQKSINNPIYSNSVRDLTRHDRGLQSNRRNAQVTRGNKLKENLRKIQSENGLILNDEVQIDNNTLNFTIEMETGTGKTYVYLRTILDLYFTYDKKFKKFIIVVPSVPIRMGVEKSIQMLKEHFSSIGEYKGIDITKYVFVYNSKIKGMAGTVRHQFVDTEDLSILVMNTQAFNRDTNVLRNTDHESNVDNLSVWDEIRQLHPVVIIDEPQKFDGAKNMKKKSRTASLAAIDSVKPTFIVRYSATHNEIINPTYKLDSYAAYKNNLVKRIKVKTVNKLIPTDFPYIRYLEFTKDLYAKIEIFSAEQGKEAARKVFRVRKDNNGNIFELSGELPQYRNYRIAENPFKGKSLKIERPDGIIEIKEGSCISPFSEKDAVRIQMKIAIQSHLEHQYNLLKQGKEIKALSLFFIDRVSKVRGEDGKDGEYLRLFDSVYSEVICNPNYNKVFKEFPEYFKEYSNVNKIRQGYFAIDKKKSSTKIMEIDGWNEESDDSTISLKAKQKEYIERGIELILEKKDELISFETPLAFIFSHSALREGWDNPNVFTLCTLKNSSNSIAKKQEIGRGLRLPVDIHGNRCHDEKLNVLTVVANDSYEHFSEKLQKSYNDESGFNKDEVTNDIIGKVFNAAGIPIDKISSKLATSFMDELKSNGIVSANGILKKDTENKFKDIEFIDEILKEHATKIKEEFAKYMVDKGSKKISIENGDLEPVENKMQSYVSEKDFKKLILDVNSRLSQKTIYKVNIDKDVFVKECINSINEMLNNKNINEAVEQSVGMHYIDENNKARYEKADKSIFINNPIINVNPRSDFEIINYLMGATDLPRLTIKNIINGVINRRLLDSQDYLDDVMNLIKEIFIKHQAQPSITYDVLCGYRFDSKTIFAVDEINATEINDPDKFIYKSSEISRKAINEYYKFDSEGELKFAESLDNDPNVLLFTKIKKGGFVINTPYGNYSPDWAVVYRNEGKAELYFIVETKFDKGWNDLSDVEQFKIHCGKAHFKTIEENTNESVKFNWANSYNDFKEKFNIQNRF